MGTKTATGMSTLEDSVAAAKAATEQAKLGLVDRRPKFGFVFAGPNHDLAAVIRAVETETGCEQLVGCSTAGEFTQDGLVHGGVVVMLAAGEDIAVTSCFTTGIKEDHESAASQLGSSYDAISEQAFGDGLRRSTSILLTDGLAGTGEDLVQLLAKNLPPGVQIVGGAAGDEAKFEQTQVGTPEASATGAAAAMHVFSRRPWGVGVDHGLRPTTEPVRVTRADGNIVYEINGEPAFEIYKRHAADRGVELTAENRSSYMIGNELGVHVFDRLARARAPLFVGDDGSLTCAAAIPEGAAVSILDGEPDNMVSAAERAAIEARESFNGEAAGVVVFDCVCRGMILGDQFQREIDAVRNVFGDVPVAGFLTYGEIARYPGQFSGWHNTTAVVVAIPA